MNKIRKISGVCPQHDLVFEALTCIDNLALVGAQKGMTDDDLKSGAVKRMLDEVCASAQGPLHAISRVCHSLACMRSPSHLVGGPRRGEVQCAYGHPLGWAEAQALARVRADRRPQVRPARRADGRHGPRLASDGVGRHVQGQAQPLDRAHNSFPRRGGRAGRPRGHPAQGAAAVRRLDGRAQGEQRHGLPPHRLAHARRWLRRRDAGAHPGARARGEHPGRAARRGARPPSARLPPSAAFPRPPLPSQAFHCLLTPSIAFAQVRIRLPQHASAAFSGLFTELDASVAKLGVNSYGLSIPTLQV